MRASLGVTPAALLSHSEASLPLLQHRVLQLALPDNRHIRLLAVDAHDDDIRVTRLTVIRPHQGVLLLDELPAKLEEVRLQTTGDRAGGFSSGRRPRAIARIRPRIAPTTSASRCILASPDNPSGATTCFATEVTSARASTDSASMKQKWTRAGGPLRGLAHTDLRSSERTIKVPSDRADRSPRPLPALRSPSPRPEWPRPCP